MMTVHMDIIITLDMMHTGTQVCDQDHTCTTLPYSSKPSRVERRLPSKVRTKTAEVLKDADCGIWDSRVRPKSTPQRVADSDNWTYYMSFRCSDKMFAFTLNEAIIYDVAEQPRIKS